MVGLLNCRHSGRIQNQNELHCSNRLINWYMLCLFEIVPELLKLCHNKNVWLQIWDKLLVHTQLDSKIKEEFGCCDAVTQEVQMLL